MPKKILYICGSPRQGNCEYILTQIKKELDGELVLLRELNLKPCTGCLNCHNTPRCSIKNDGGNALLEKIINADLVVAGIPNYFDNVPGIFKVFNDRMHPLGGKTWQGKDVIFIFVGSGKPEATKYALLTALNGAIRYYRINVLDTLVTKALNYNDSFGNYRFIDEAVASITKHL